MFRVKPNVKNTKGIFWRHGVKKLKQKLMEEMYKNLNENKTIERIVVNQLSHSTGYRVNWIDPVVKESVSW